EDRLGQIQSDNRHLLHLHSPSPTYPQKNIPRGGEPSTTSIAAIWHYPLFRQYEVERAQPEKQILRMVCRVLQLRSRVAGRMGAQLAHDVRSE
ncbi:hypothetical protein M9978_22360, partial [Sphingomonas sp. MG17]